MKKLNETIGVNSKYDNYDKAGRTFFLSLNGVTGVEVVVSPFIKGEHNNYTVDDVFFLDEEYIVEFDKFNNRITLLASKKVQNEYNLLEILKRALDVKVVGDKDKAWTETKKKLTNRNAWQVQEELYIAQGSAHRLDEPVKISITKE